MVTLDGNNINVPGQVSIGTPPSDDSHAPRNDDKRFLYRVCASITGVDANGSAPYDAAPIPIPCAKYIVVEMVVLNASADHHAATVGLFTAASGGGTQVIAATALAGVTGSSKFKSLAYSGQDVLTAANLYPHFTVASGNAGTLDILLVLKDVSTVKNMT